MGWFWGATKPKSDDPIGNLDPALRQYLENESPDKYTPSKPEPLLSEPPKASPEPSSRTDASSNVSATPTVPRQSLFQDGRYSHLWKSYEPLSSIEARVKSDHDKLMDIVEVHKDRKARIGRAAIENCALEQTAVSDCMRKGTWADRFVLCRTENRRFDRCYLMQAKFLRALGYMSVLERSPEEDERIQMHADTLYHRMLEHEKLVEKAKAEGKPIPELKPVMSRENFAAVLGSGPTQQSPTTTTATSSVALTSNLPTPRMPGRGTFTLEQVPEARRKDLQRRLEGLSPEERALELREFEAELDVGLELSKELGTIFEDEKRKRLERKERGSETVMDAVKRWWGW